jgi:glycosyltransferase involved in cell wall biosynthesis
VLALVPNLLDVSPGQRSSVELWERPLAAAGIDLTFLPFESPALHDSLYGSPPRRGRRAVEMVKSYGRRFRDVADVEEYDAVLVYREAALVGPAVFERLVARRRVPIIYQLDDPLQVPYTSPYTGKLSYLKFFGKVRSICRMATTVIVNSSPLRAFAAEHNDNVWQVPSLVDTNVYSYRPRAETDDVCVGWSGSPTTVNNVQLVAEALRVIQHDTDCRIKLIGSAAVGIPGVDATAQPWRRETEVDDLREFDVGLVPIPDVPWNHYKFFMKLAQYMALGIPPVATPMGSVVEDVEHGVNGFIAESTSEWVDAVETLVRDPALRRRMSEAAAQTAAARFSLAANGPKIVDAFRSALG